MRYTILLFLLNPSFLFSQTQGSDALSNMQGMQSGSMFRSFDNRYKGVEGFPTLFEKYVPGKIVFSSGATMDHPQVNYDAVTHELLVIRDKAELVIDTKMIRSFALIKDSDTLKFIKVRFESGVAFTECLVAGKASLYKQTSKIVRPATNTGAYSSGKSNGELEEVVKYFWLAGDGIALEIKNKKDFVRDLQAALHVDYGDYIKDNKVNLKNESSMTGFFDYVNSQ